MDKNTVQQNGLELTDTYPFILYEWSTGTGKSLMAIKIIEKFRGNWHICIAETNHELNWVNEFKAHGKEYLLKQVKFFCYQSLHKYLDGENYIFDEVHHITSDLRLDLISRIKFRRFIGLSATLTRNQKIAIKNIIGDYHIYRISLSEAIDAGILPEPTVYFVGVNLDNTRRNLKFNFNKEKFVYCTELEMYNRMSDRVDYFKEQFLMDGGINEIKKIKWLKYANDRKKFLSDCKTIHAKHLLEKLVNKRYICFTGSIEQAETLGHGKAIHSHLSKQERVQLLDDFNNYRINHLFAKGMLKEGQNLPGIEVGVIVQLDNQERYFTQVHGRCLRAKYPEQYVMYIKHTQDETYVNTALEDFNMDYVKYVTLDEI